MQLQAGFPPGQFVGGMQQRQPAQAAPAPPFLPGPAAQGIPSPFPGRTEPPPQPAQAALAPPFLPGATAPGMPPPLPGRTEPPPFPGDF
jgi:hypothetical protein